jgi:hypothetical protein
MNMRDTRIRAISLEVLTSETNRVLRYEISMFSFYHWFMSHTWGVHLWEIIPAKEFASALDLLFSEYTGKFISEEQLREEMGRLVANKGHIPQSAIQPPSSSGKISH